MTNVMFVIVETGFWKWAATRRAIILFMNDKLSRHMREGSAIGVKPVSEFDSKRLVCQGIQYAIDHNRASVTLAHRGNIMKVAEGGDDQFVGVYASDCGECVAPDFYSAGRRDL